MIIAIGRYAALLGFTFAVLLHLAGYLYLDLPYPAFQILTLGIIVLAPLALRGPFLGIQTPVDTLAKKAFVGLAVGGTVLWLLTTLIWISVRGPEVGTGSHAIRLPTILPAWQISGPHYRMLTQQWQTFSAALVYGLFWFRLRSNRPLASMADPAANADSLKAAEAFPSAVKRVLAGTILTSLGLFVVGHVLRLVGLVEKGVSDVMALFSLIALIAAAGIAGIGAILAALRDKPGN